MYVFLFQTLMNAMMRMVAAIKFVKTYQDHIIVVAIPDTNFQVTSVHVKVF